MMIPHAMNFSRASTSENCSGRNMHRSSLRREHEKSEESSGKGYVWPSAIQGPLANISQLREERNAEFQRIVEENEKALRKLRGESDSQSEEESDSNEEEWEGFEEPPAVDYEAEYIDEDKYTTVTVEEMDASKEGLYKAEKDESDESRSRKGDTVPATAKSNSATKKAKKAGDDKPKKKKKKFRYESKEDRKLARAKQKMSNKRKADARRER